MYDSQSVYGMTPQAPSWGVAAPTQHMGTSDVRQGWRALIDPHNPLLWFGVVLAVTLGAAGVAGSVRLGPAKVAAQVGSS